MAEIWRVLPPGRRAAPDDERRGPRPRRARRPPRSTARPRRPAGATSSSGATRRGPWGSGCSPSPGRWRPRSTSWSGGRCTAASSRRGRRRSSAEGCSRSSPRELRARGRAGPRSPGRPRRGLPAAAKAGLTAVKASPGAARPGRAASRAEDRPHAPRRQYDRVVSGARRHGTAGEEGDHPAQHSPARRPGPARGARRAGLGTPRRPLPAPARRPRGDGGGAAAAVGRRARGDGRDRRASPGSTRPWRSSCGCRATRWTPARSGRWSRRRCPWRRPRWSWSSPRTALRAARAARRRGADPLLGDPRDGDRAGGRAHRGVALRHLLHLLRVLDPGRRGGAGAARQLRQRHGARARRPHFERRALLVGAPALVSTIAESLERSDARQGVPYRVVGREQLVAGVGLRTPRGRRAACGRRWTRRGWTR